MATLVGILLYAAGSVRAIDVVLNWAPASAGIDQLQRERRAEAAALLGHWSLGCLAAAALLGFVGITVVWHRGVPGAMCGTGVLQAMGTNGSRAMIFWGAALIILYGWRVLDRLDSHQPQGVLTQANVRVMISATPFLALAIFYTWQALIRIETVPPVSCCAFVYDQVLIDTDGYAATNRFKSIFFWCSLAGGAALLVLAALKSRFPCRGPGALMAVIGIFWALGAAITVTHVWSAYYYQVLSHPCPWCLFLPEHHGTGFFIFGSVAMVVLETIALWQFERVRYRYPVLAGPAERRIRQSGRRIVIAMIGFTALTLGPAIFWRIETGVWLNDFF